MKTVAAAGFVVPFFFFALVAVALARVEEVSRLPRSGSGRAGFAGFWIGSTVGAVALLMLLGMVVAVFFYGGGLRQVLHWLSPLWLLVQILVAGVAVLILMLVELIVSLLHLDLSAISDALRQMLQNLGRLLVNPTATPPPGSETRPAVLGVLQAVVTTAIPVVVILLVVLFTWSRVRRGRRQEGDESRESLLSAGTVARSLQAMLQAGLDRLGELADLVDRFGLGSRFLSAISIRRIYANLVRLATEAGYPRPSSQTPYEYLEALHQALPGTLQRADVALITEAYVNAHYGQVPDSREDLQRIRDCWERVRAREEERRGR